MAFSHPSFSYDLYIAGRCAYSYAAMALNRVLTCVPRDYEYESCGRQCRRV